MLGTLNPATGTPYPAPDEIIAADFGANDALAFHGHEGPIKRPKLPPVKGGKSVSDDFTRYLPIFLDRAHVVVESPTVGSSGVEPDEVAQIVAAAPHDLWVVSARAVKHYRQDHGLVWRKGARYAKDGTTPPPQVIEIEEQADVHLEDAEIIYRIAVERPQRMRRWKLPDDKPLTRAHTSVRPYDKRNYRGDVPDAFMARFPPFASLPPDLQALLGNAVGTANADYSRSRAMPFAMALDEPGTDTRTGYERVIGLYDHGYPSFYRRATIVLLHENAKRLAGVTRIAEVPPSTRKEAWRVTRKQIRHIYGLIK